MGLYIYIIKKFSIKQLMNYQCILYFVTSTSLSLLFIGIPVSRSLSSVGMGLVLFTWLVSGDYQGKWQRIRDNPLSLPVFLLWLLTFVASLWSVGDWATIENQFFIYVRLLWFFLILSLIQTQQHKKWAWWAFFAGCAINVVMGLVNTYMPVEWYGILGLTKWSHETVLGNHNAQGAVIAFFAAACFVYMQSCQTKSMKTLCAVFFALAVTSSALFSQSRSGFVVTALAVLAVLFVSVNKDKRLALGVGLCIVLMGLSYFSPKMSARFVQMNAEINQYFSTGNFETSVGFRIEMWRRGVDFFLSSPIWGHGTGSYYKLASAVYTEGQCATVCNHPHNQFLFFAVEFGIIGVGLFVYWFYKMLKSAAMSVSEQDRYLWIAFVVVFVGECFLNLPLYSSSERTFFICLMGLLVCSPLKNTRPQQ